jgi:hypothetical protein
MPPPLLLPLLILLLSPSLSLSKRPPPPPYPINCTNGAKLLSVTESEIFAHGHSKGVVTATLPSASLSPTLAAATAASLSLSLSLADHLPETVPVVIKFPRGDFATSKLSASERSFAKEMAKIEALQGHPGIPLLYGGCEAGGTLPKKVIGESGGGSGATLPFLVSEELTTWWTYHKADLPWCLRAHSAITLLSLFQFLQGDFRKNGRHKEQTGGGYLHCDLNKGQFAFSVNGEAKLVDFGGLEYYESFPAYAADTSCTLHRLSQCSSSCMTSWYSKHRSVKGLLGEFTCDTKEGHCRGFDPSANLWVLCSAMLAELLDERVFSDAGVDPRQYERLSDALKGCMALHRVDRWSIEDMLATLRSFMDEAGGMLCLRREGIRVNPVYYDSTKPPTTLRHGQAKHPDALIAAGTAQQQRLKDQAPVLAFTPAPPTPRPSPRPTPLPTASPTPGPTASPTPKPTRSGHHPPTPKKSSHKQGGVRLGRYSSWMDHY